MPVATARLEHFAVVTFDADADALRRLLPEGVEVDLPLVSAVAYRYEGLTLRPLPWPRLAAAQVHLRAYVRIGGESGVWFVRTMQDSRWATLPHLLWAMPWERDDVSIDGTDGGCLSIAADGIALALLPLEASPPSAIPDKVAAATIGWFEGRQGIMRFEVAYDVGELQCVNTGEARVGAFEELGLVAPGQRPHSAFLHPRSPIDIHLPPRRAER